MLRVSTLYRVPDSSVEVEGIGIFVLRLIRILSTGGTSIFSRESPLSSRPITSEVQTSPTSRSSAAFCTSWPSSIAPPAGVLSWRLSNTLHARSCAEALERYGQRQIFNTDHGNQFASLVSPQPQRRPHRHAHGPQGLVHRRHSLVECLWCSFYIRGGLRARAHRRLPGPPGPSINDLQW